MGYLKDITDTIRDLSVIAKTATNRNNADSKSIAKKAKEGILQFPFFSNIFAKCIKPTRK